MFRSSRSVTTTAVLAACLTLAAARTHAQQGLPARGLFVGAGVGVGTIQDPDAGLHRFGPSLYGLLGWAFGERTAAMVEVGVHGFGDERAEDFSDHLAAPLPGGIPPDDPVRVDAPRVLHTVSLLASVQVAVSDAVYLRPGLGVSRHSFATFVATPAGWMGAVSHEVGPAAEITVGHLAGAGQRLPVAMEGFALLSHGEDSSGSRWAVGFRIVPQVRF